LSLFAKHIIPFWFIAICCYVFHTYLYIIHLFTVKSSPSWPNLFLLNLFHNVLSMATAIITFSCSHFLVTWHTAKIKLFIVFVANFSSQYCVTRAQPFSTLSWSWNDRPCDTGGGESSAWTQSLGTWSSSVPPSLIWVITNIVGTARNQSLTFAFLTRFGAWGSVREKRTSVNKLI
jgi:hypothetical protein